MTLYCAGYGLTVTGLRAKGWGSVMLRAQVRIMVRTGVAEGIVLMKVSFSKVIRIDWWSDFEAREVAELRDAVDFCLSYS